MQDVMVDLETLGQVPGSVILSIGAVAFDPASGKLGPEFYCVVNTESCRVLGLTKDMSTVNWWEKQSEEAKQVLKDAESLETSSQLDSALNLFNDYLHQFNLGEVRVWGNGADFDNAMLAAAYRACSAETPWKFWNNRCFRTLKNLVRLPKLQREGTHHNALDDAIYQARDATRIIRRVQYQNSLSKVVAKYEDKQYTS